MQGKSRKTQENNKISQKKFPKPLFLICRILLLKREHSVNFIEGVVEPSQKSPNGMGMGKTPYKGRVDFQREE